MTVPQCQVAIILLRRSNGDWFVHQRLATKRWFPGLFGLGAGGSIEPGETPAGAARRELFEETGIEATPSPVFEADYQDGSLRHRLAVFELVTSSEPARDEREWQWSGWLPESEIARLAAEGQLCPDTRMVFERYLAGRGARAAPDQDPASS